MVLASFDQGNCVKKMCHHIENDAIVSFRFGAKISLKNFLVVMWSFKSDSASSCNWLEDSRVVAEVHEALSLPDRRGEM